MKRILCFPALLALMVMVCTACGTDYLNDSKSDDKESDGDAAETDGDSVEPDGDFPALDGDGSVPDGDAADGDGADGDGVDGDAEEPDGDADFSEGDIEEEDPEPQVVSESFSVRASVEQLHIWNAEPELVLEILDPDGEVIHTEETDYLGSLIVRELEPGRGYMVRLADDPNDYTDKLRVMSVENSLPRQSFYNNQKLEPGFGYLTTRDGTKLSIFVSLPGPPEDGPYPTLVNYSGYSPSRPGRSLGGTAELFCGTYPVLCNAPDFASGIIAGVMGYATVGVNLRGTGCSGGAYDYFETLQLLDGYDVIETVASQDWVQYHEVGMVGLSFPGITQLFVASVRPPSLAAIAPFSVIADTASSTLVPGGIYNNGFALEWIEGVLNKAAPYAHQWIQDIVDEGDSICEEHQLLHSQKLDAVAKALENPYYTDEIAKPLDPTSFVDQIEVPVFLVGQCQDEQTGPHFPILFEKFTSSPSTHFTMTNGVHMDGFSPQILGEWANFLSLYVKREIPDIDGAERALVPIFMEEVFGSSGMELSPARFDDYEDYQQALADYEAEDKIRVIFESGAHPDVQAGAPYGTFEAHFPQWPIPSSIATRLYFQADGSLSENLPGENDGASSFEHEAEAGERKTLNSGSVNNLQPDYNYRQLVEGKAASFITAPLDQDMVLVGSGSVDLWLMSTADDADLEVNLSEVRSDGMESYVQSGWLRASHRILKDESTELRPISSHYEEDVLPLEDGEWNLVRVELMPFSHIFRAGSRIHLSVDTPGDSRASWKFLLLEYDTPPTHNIAHMADYPSSVVLPVIPNIDVPTDMPDCTALRGQPCRTYESYENTIAE